MTAKARYCLGCGHSIDDRRPQAKYCPDHLGGQGCRKRYKRRGYAARPVVDSDTDRPDWVHVWADACEQYGAKIGTQVGTCGHGYGTYEDPEHGVRNCFACGHQVGSVKRHPDFAFYEGFMTTDADGEPLVAPSRNRVFA